MSLLTDSRPTEEGLWKYADNTPLSTCLGVVCSVEDGAGAEAQPREAAGHPPGHVLDVGDADAGLRHAVEEPVPVPSLLQLLGDHLQHPGDEPDEGFIITLRRRI